MSSTTVPVADVIEIAQLLALYGHVVDDAKFTPVDSPAQQRMSEVFAADGVFDVSAINGRRYVGLDAIRETFARPAPYHPPAHHSTNMHVYREGDIVRARSKFVVFGWSGELMLGEYRDTLAHGPGGWRISERVVVETFRRPHQERAAEERTDLSTTPPGPAERTMPMTAPEIPTDLTLYLVAQDLLARYAHGVDHGDLEAALGVFWPEATDHHGDVWDGNAQEYMRDMVGRARDARDRGVTGPWFQHHMTSILVRQTVPDRARVQAGYLAYVPHTVDGIGRVGLVVGRFLDEIERRGDVWKVISREIVNDFTDGDVGATPFPSGSWQHGGYPGGSYSADDPGVAFLAGGTD